MQRITVGVDAGKRTHQVAAYDPAAGTVVGQGSFEGITNRGATSPLSATADPRVVGRQNLGRAQAAHS